MKKKLRGFIILLLVFSIIAGITGNNFLQFKIKQLAEKVLWEDNVSSIVLMESHLSPSGANYEVLEEFKFCREY